MLMYNNNYYTSTWQCPSLVCTQAHFYKLWQKWWQICHHYITKSTRPSQFSCVCWKTWEGLGTMLVIPCTGYSSSSMFPFPFFFISLTQMWSWPTHNLKIKRTIIWHRKREWSMVTLSHMNLHSLIVLHTRLERRSLDSCHASFVELIRVPGVIDCHKKCHWTHFQICLWFIANTSDCIGGIVVVINNSLPCSGEKLIINNSYHICGTSLLYTVTKASLDLNYTCTERKTFNQPFVVRQANKSMPRITVLIHIHTDILLDWFYSYSNIEQNNCYIAIVDLYYIVPIV